MINKRVISSVKKTLGNIESSLFPTLKDVFTKRADIIKEIQTDEQLFTKGEDSKGISITPSYANSTISFKIKNNQPFDRVTLKDTGGFYASINVIADNDKLVIETSIEYAKYLTAKYGKEILGIQDMELKEFVKRYIEPELETNICKIISTEKL